MKNILQLKHLRYFSIYCILLLVFLTDYIVYTVGGTEFAFTHIMYVPIIFTAFIFGTKGGALIGILAGLTLGPAMPMNVAEGAMQAPASWMLRMIFFIVMGSLVGSLIDRIKLDRDLKIKKSYEHYLTGYPNHSKLRLDLKDILAARKDCTLVVFKIINLGYINRYVDYQVEEKTIFYVIETILKHFNKCSLYCVTRNEYVLVFPDRSIQEIQRKAEKLLETFDEPVLIDGMPIDLFVRSGIANYPMHSLEPDDLLIKLERTLDQDKDVDNKISIYQNSIAEKNKENYELVVALYDAIKNDEFSIVYQPKIELSNNVVMGLEALLRWTHHTKGKISPEQFIQLAEYMGIINDITKWVIKNTIDQLKKWKEEGLTTKVAINISSRDLRDDSIIQYTKNYMKSTQVDPEQLEFELTERTIVDNENRAVHL
ncbi:MAG: EAL domain-containing protein, partial [Bacillota bacterium]